jgi:hypothetical protein
VNTCANCQSPIPASLSSCPHCETSSLGGAARPAFAALLLGLAACNGDDTNDQALYGVAVVDADQDGYDELEDCDDEDAAVNPGATEVAGNGVDDDCDESTTD